MEASKNDESLTLVEKVDDDLKETGKYNSKCQENENHGECAICFEKIVLQETALIKGCKHAYCVICILRWASYNKNPCCPQCKIPFEFINVHRSLDGCIHDFMIEESVSLLLRASWFVPLLLEPQEETYENPENHYEGQDFFTYENPENHYQDEYFFPYEEQDDIDEDDIGEVYFDDFFLYGHRCPKKKKESSSDAIGRRAKRALKREAADKHQQHLQRK